MKIQMFCKSLFWVFNRFIQSVDLKDDICFCWIGAGCAAGCKPEVSGTGSGKNSSITCLFLDYHSLFCKFRVTLYRNEDDCTVNYFDKKSIWWFCRGNKRKLKVLSIEAVRSP